MNDHFVENFLESITIGEPLCHKGLSIFPLKTERTCTVDHIILEEALATGRFEITEVSQGGSVPELLAVNRTESHVLLVDGEELVGARQNRILNVSVLVAPMSSVKISVSCVEAGRWDYRSPNFAAGMFAPCYLRAKTSKEVPKSQGRRSNQRRVWSNVAFFLDNHHTQSPTNSLHDLFASRDNEFSSIEKALPMPDGTNGYIAMLGKRVVGCDLFGRNDVLQRKWPRIIRSLAAEALVAKGKCDQARVTDADRFLTDALASDTESIELPGAGTGVHLHGSDVTGTALLSDETVLHLSLFSTIV
mgnify:CR=1 FL=1